ncbi:MAG: TIGR03960 family B12-binding radical SAM protein [Clostridia bacterium]|nr:TIGR03960 family B12-binding radical SAM protein [Clostridia bacterium]
MNKIDLTKITKPSRYVGGEYNTPKIKKDAKVQICFCFPDVYEVGMSNLGMRILYYMLNSLDFVSCERCFAPWEDYAEALHEKDAELCSLESGTPLKNFDMVAFSVQYELCYTNVLYMLELAKIPLRTAERKQGDPIVLAGGPCSVNLEPLADFCDFIDIGEGEDVLKRIAECLAVTKGKSRADIVAALDQLEGCYAPSLHPVGFFYETDSEGNRTFVGQSLPDKVVKQQKVADMNACFCPETAQVPNLEIIHDRAVVEIFRGCANGCRFCQAGFIYRPVRERTPEYVAELSKKLLDSTGYDEISLNSLSTSDYSHLRELIDYLTPYAEVNHVNYSLPSLRMDSFLGEYADKKRKSSLTFAVEAGTQRLRNVINKNITEENVLSCLTQAFQMGYSSVKLYFMLGLPTETMDDVKAIAELAYKIHALYNREKCSKKPLKLNVSASVFIPKPFTPFQWEAFDSRESVEEKQRYLKETLRKKGIAFNYHDYDSSVAETLLARGDRRLGNVLERVYKQGGIMDGWCEYFALGRYIDALKCEKIDINEFLGAQDVNKVLPWDYVDIGVNREYFLAEREKAYKAETTPNCYKQCNNCGLLERGMCSGKVVGT